MRSKLFVAGFVVAVLAVAGCGSSKKKTTSSTASSSAPVTTTTTTHKKAKAKAAVASRTYKLKLTGKAETPPGAPKGVGAAVITLHGKTLQVCWRFSHLHGFTNPTFAHIHKAPKGKPGNIVVPLSTSAVFHHQGCVHTSTTLLKAIEKDPHGYYVNIHSKKYPGGAVRSQL